MRRKATTARLSSSGRAKSGRSCRSMRLETPFQRVDQLRDGHLRWIADQEEDLIVLAMHLRQWGFEVGANLPNSSRRRSTASPSRTRYRCLVMKPKWNAMQKLECLPRLSSLLIPMDQIY